MDNGKLSDSVRVTNSNTMDFEVAGVNVSIGKLLGDKIVEEMMTRITPEEMQCIFDYMKKETWSVNYQKEPILNWKRENSYSSNTKPPELATFAYNLLRDRLKEAIQIKVEEIVKSEEFIEKADVIATEIVEYATEGYKKDMKSRIYERLVGNVTDGCVSYGGISLIDLIRSEIHNTISGHSPY